MQKVLQRLLWCGRTLRTFELLVTLNGPLCDYTQAEYPYLLFALGLVTLVNGLISTNLWAKRKRRQLPYVFQVQHDPNLLWMKPMLMRTLQMEICFALYTRFARC